MIDYIKIRTHNQQIIQRLFGHKDFIICKPCTTFHYSYKHKLFKYNMRMDFLRAIENGVIVGYSSLSIGFNPHYFFNNNLHNGNDLTPIQAMESIIAILEYLGIEKEDYDELIVCNLEFGLNLKLDLDVNKVIDGLLLFKRKCFVVKSEKYPYSKLSDTSKFKFLKIYNKGIQFCENPEFGIDINTIRYEIVIKESKKLKEHGISTVNDLLSLETYSRLGQYLLDEWMYVLFGCLDPNVENLSLKERNFVANANNIGFWLDLNATSFQRNKNKYRKLLNKEDNYHHIIQIKIMEKLDLFFNGGGTDNKKIGNSEKEHISNDAIFMLNVENITFTKKNHICPITMLNISMQKDSIFLSTTGIKYYYENDPLVFNELKIKYLKKNKWNEPLGTQFYYIAHNIRNKNFNVVHNRRRFEKRNYHPNQLQFNFQNCIVN